EILGAFKAVAAADRWCSVHPWDKWFHDAATQSVRDEGLPMVTENVRPRWYDNEEMAGAMYQLYYLAKKAGMKWYAMHAWMPDSIDLVRLAKKEGVIPVVGSFELMPSIDPAEHLYYPEKGEWSKWDISHDAVPDEDYMWASVMDGTIDFIGTDHAPHSRKDYEYLLEEKPADWIPASLGYPLLDWHGHLLLNKVNKGYLTLEKLVEATSVNGAKIFGFYPNKGSNLPGTDADFTIVDMEKEWAINSDHVYTKSGLNSYHGRKIKGQVTHTIVRGSVVMENDEVIGKPGFGKFIKPVK
ncbi:MAG: dihydroorotase family protein, partial [Clostridiales bacterium]|nr:dihydroorotase family protein [Clostridiales bacterium]